jgi:hypothetical protein
MGSLRTANCNVCSNLLTHYPFMEWHGAEIFLCAKCAHDIKQGFTADLIHIAAIYELHGAGYHQHTLVRK